MFKIRQRALRLFTEAPKFSDRWSPAPTVAAKDLPAIIEVPKFPVDLDPKLKIHKDRVFDTELPEYMRPQLEALQIWAMADGQFSVNGVWIPGSVIVFRDVVLQWDVKHPDHIQEYHLDMLRFMRPKLEYVIIGTGKLGKPVLSQAALRRYQSIGLSIDTCATVLVT